MLNGFKAEGGVSLIAAKIGRDLDCRGGQFIGTSLKLQLLTQARQKSEEIWNARVASLWGMTLHSPLTLTVLRLRVASF